MAYWYSVGLAALIYYLCLWIYHRPLTIDKPVLPSVLVLMTVMDLLACKVHVGEELTQSHEPVKLLYEVSFSIFYLDMGMRDFWHSLETKIIVLIKQTLTGSGLVSEGNFVSYKQYWIGSLTLPLSLLILLLAGKTTKHLQLIMNAATKLLGSKAKVPPATQEGEDFEE
ncbi:uncharacterized protein LOC117903036 [Drosophila subobscura]|uniref:uncharacterized protein LOC117903036 n=1 Tax=Drosophila subobscura TaxID=7241 RepID=UPI00155A6251|nr:uncharacterized protein LOC117903036 [Drosophila subobscura]